MIRMRIKRFKCKVINYKGRFVIVPINKILRFLGILPIANAKGDIVNCAGDWTNYKSAKWAYNNLMKTDYVEI